MPDLSVEVRDRGHRHLEAERRPYDDLSEGGRRALPRSSFGSDFSRQPRFQRSLFSSSAHGRPHSRGLDLDEARL